MTADPPLSGIPSGLREPLISCFAEIGRNYFERRWEPSELNGGKFCEVVYTVAHGALTGKFATKPSKPRNMVAACRGLEDMEPPKGLVGARTLRILIPRMLPPLYEIRNNRGVGHVGAEVDPNFLDATCVFQMTSWIMAELIRIYHDVPLEQAQRTVDSLVEFKHPLVWQFGSIRRVLAPKMKLKDQTLTLLYGQVDGVREADLLKWVESSTASNYRRGALLPLHKDRLIEYDQPSGLVRITPLGTKSVEDRLLETTK